MEKKNNGMLIAIIAVVIIAIVAVVVGIIAILSGKKDKDESYRFVKVESFEGKVRLERGDDDEEVFEGLMLIPEDMVTVKEDSYMELLVDSDKHIMAENSTKFEVTATGTEDAGKVVIRIKYGAALFEIENKLNDESKFEVKTPNATLSVRGTKFRVEYDEEQEITKVVVYDGVVHAETNTDEFDIEKGQEVWIYDDYYEFISNGAETAGAEGIEAIDDSTDVEPEPETEPELEIEEAVIVGEITDDTLDTIFPGLTTTDVAVALGGVNSAVFNNRTDYMSDLYFLINHSNFSSKINSDNSVLELLDTKSGSGYDEYYYNLEDVERLFAVISQGRTLSEVFPDNIVDGMFVCKRYTTVVEDECPATPEYVAGYVDEDGVVYIQMKNNYPSLYGDPAWSDVLTATFIKGDDGYVLDSVYKNSTIDDLL